MVDETIFDGNFPELRDKGKKVDGFPNVRVFYDFDVEENCLSKQRVRQALNILDTYGYDGEESEDSRENQALRNRHLQRLLIRKLGMEETPKEAKR